MPPFKVLVTDYAWPSLKIEQKILKSVNAALLLSKTDEEAELLTLASKADAILTCWAPISEALVDSAKKAIIISRYGVGLDNIPVDYATKSGILVTNVPRYCTEEVSDHAMALILACARNIVQHVNNTRQGQWDAKAVGRSARLCNQTIGMIGCGRTARALIPKALGFEMKIIAHTPRIVEGALAPFAKTTRKMKAMLNEADYVSVHVPLTEETRGMVDKKIFKQMKSTAYLINTSRGAVVNEPDLIDALKTGQIAGAALDVLTQEPPDPDNPLLKMDNVIVTPHAAFYSEDSISELQTTAATQVVQALSGQKPDNLVNPTVLAQPNVRLKAI